MISLRSFAPTSLAILLALVPAAAQAATTSSKLEISVCDAGVHYQFEKLDCPIALDNSGDTPITVSKGKARWDFDSIEDGEVVVPAHGTVELATRVNVRNNAGLTTRAFRFWSDEGEGGYRGSEVRFFGLSVLTDPKPELQFGNVRMDEKLPRASVTLASRDIEDFRIESIESKPDWLNVSIGKDHRTVSATVLPSAPWGPVTDQYVKVKINTAHQTQAWIAVDFSGIGEVAASGNPYALGVIRTGDNHTSLIRVTDRKGKPLHLGKLRLEGIVGKTSIEPCEHATVDCRLIKLEVSDDQKLGRLQGTLHVDLPEYKRELPIDLIGMLLSPKTKIHQWDEVAKQSGVAESKAEKPVDFAAALKRTVEKTEAAPPPLGDGPLLNWSVAHQAGLYGYMIYRADKEAGPFLRINKEIIQAHADGSDRSGSYQWRDHSAEPGQTYWYIIGVIKQDGTKKDLSAPKKVIAKTGLKTGSD